MAPNIMATKWLPTKLSKSFKTKRFAKAHFDTVVLLYFYWVEEYVHSVFIFSFILQ